MQALLIWVSFVLLMSLSEGLDLNHFLLFSGFMFYFHYISNEIKPINLSWKAIVLLVNLPTTLFWYLAFVYNDFLCITPVSYEVFLSVFSLYLFANFYICSRSFCNKFYT